MNQHQKMQLKLSVLIAFLSACDKPYQQEFLHVVQDHKYVSEVTCNTLMRSLDEELERTDLSDLDRMILIDLKKRLFYIKDSAEIMEEYVISTTVSHETLSKLLKSRWQQRTDS